MNIREIIKDAFLFPSKNTGRFAIYLLLSVLMVGFALGGIFTYAYGIIDAENYLTGGIYIIISILIGFLIFGYHIKVIKSGIEHDNNVPVFELYEDFMTGFDNVLVLILYFITPTLIVMLVGFGTNLFGNAMDVVNEFALQIFNVYIMDLPLDIAVNAISPVLIPFLNSFAITLTVALVVFLIFSILYLMAETRLANTGSFRQALNIFEAAKDITRIGVGKVVLLVLAIVVVIAIIEIILTIALIFYPFLVSVLYIILTPYVVLVSQRALGLLYSDIT
ncbi:MAG: DUF4013 domain-containing protein [Methanobrevibacter sp.]|uniref:DUF4013 domain-containing protein n=1 Tax=Methanobrevibacter sp. TaxID=66852 RepID=UPI0025E5E9F2|nr:DUF4013 domain-containing protein [Methanobrevibacter sp.]MBQ8018085.1 DUF4013 domain-containing protein [Methanobrevibacter sp.]